MDFYIFDFLNIGYIVLNINCFRYINRRFMVESMFGFFLVGIVKIGGKILEIIFVLNFK